MDRAWTLLAPSWFELVPAALDLSFFAWAAALAELRTAHRRPAGIIASLFSLPIAVHIATTCTVAALVRNWPLFVVHIVPLMAIMAVVLRLHSVVKPHAPAMEAIVRFWHLKGLALIQTITGLRAFLR